MAEIVRMPKLSDTMTDGVVAKWHKKVGDKVKSGELLADIETDKATMEFESFQNGVLLHIGVQEGKGAPVDSVLAILGNAGEDVTALLAEEAKKGVENLKVESPKVEVVAQKVEVKTSPANIIQQPATNNQRPTTNNERTKISPLAKKLAEDKGIHLNTLKGSGDGGRIVKRDIDNYKSNGNIPEFIGVESYTEEAVSQMRKTIARRLAESKFSAPHFYRSEEHTSEL